VGDEVMDTRSIGPAESFIADTVAPPVILLPLGGKCRDEEERCCRKEGEEQLRRIRLASGNVGGRGRGHGPCRGRRSRTLIRTNRVRANTVTATGTWRTPRRDRTWTLARTTSRIGTVTNIHRASAFACVATFWFTATSRCT
jgi:hypothetical protein